MIFLYLQRCTVEYQLNLASLFFVFQLADRLTPESEEAAATEMTEMLDRLLQAKDVRKTELPFTS